MQRLINSFGYAFKGLSYAFKSQLNFKIHVVALLVAVILGFVLEVSNQEWLWIALSATLVITMELLNTAIETLVDLVSPEFNVKAGLVKDLSAGAVLVCAIFSLIVASIIFLPKIIAYVA